MILNNRFLKLATTYGVAVALALFASQVHAEQKEENAQPTKKIGAEASSALTTAKPFSLVSYEENRAQGQDLSRPANLVAISDSGAEIDLWKELSLVKLLASAPAEQLPGFRLINLATLDVYGSSWLVASCYDEQFKAVVTGPREQVETLQCLAFYVSDPLSQPATQFLLIRA